MSSYRHPDTLLGVEAYTSSYANPSVYGHYLGNGSGSSSDPFVDANLSDSPYATHRASPKPQRYVSIAISRAPSAATLNVVLDECVCALGISVVGTNFAHNKKKKPNRTEPLIFNLLSPLMTNFLPSPGLHSHLPPL